MGILLIRHAEAIPERAGLEDGARWLTERGRAQALEVGAALRARSLSVARLFASPRVRAVQTAELVARALGFTGTIEILPSLSYTAPAERAASELSAFETELDDRDGLVIGVGHMPTLAQIARHLTNDTSSEGFALAEAMRIDDGSVVWSERPR